MSEMDLVIQHYDFLPNTPALPLAVRGWSELFETGLLDPTYAKVKSLSRGTTKLFSRFADIDRSEC